LICRSDHEIRGAQENLSDCDDDIGDYLITDSQELQAKEQIWMSMNEEFLAEQDGALCLRAHLIRSRPPVRRRAARAVHRRDRAAAMRCVPAVGDRAR
jgi:hypothetical protein